MESTLLYDGDHQPVWAIPVIPETDRLAVARESVQEADAMLRSIHLYTLTRGEWTDLCTLITDAADDLKEVTGDENTVRAREILGAVDRWVSDIDLDLLTPVTWHILGYVVALANLTLDRARSLT